MNYNFLCFRTCVVRPVLSLRCCYIWMQILRSHDKTIMIKTTTLKIDWYTNNIGVIKFLVSKIHVYIHTEPTHYLTPETPPHLHFERIFLFHRVGNMIPFIENESINSMTYRNAIWYTENNINFRTDLNSESFWCYFSSWDAGVYVPIKPNRQVTYIRQVYSLVEFYKKNSLFYY